MRARPPNVKPKRRIGPIQLAARQVAAIRFDLKPIDRSTMAGQETLTIDAEDRLVFQLFNEIGIIEQLARSHFESVMPDGLKLPHFSVLNHLIRLGDGTRPVDLARAFQVTKGTMTNTLGRLEARHAIRVNPDAEDGRTKRVYLTAQGRELHSRSIAALVPAFQPMKQLLPPSQFAEALPFLTDLRRYLDQARDP